jgi:putative flippase GtrA
MAFVRHQLASIVATVADFGTMVLLVEYFHRSPTLATLCGATFGAVVNFMMNRHFTFARADEAVGGQALRYAGVSGASAGLNAIGEYLGTSLLRAPYLAVRLVVAIAVSVAWNFPMHRSYVFRSAPKHP